MWLNFVNMNIAGHTCQNINTVHKEPKVRQLSSVLIGQHSYSLVPYFFFHLT
jgi:hypothetical protein